MPEMPAFLANVLEPRFGRRAEVTGVADLAPKLRKVRFEGEALRGVTFKAGHEVEFRVSDRAFRHYTPSAFDARAGAMEVVFFLHGQGPGSHWAANLRRGQTTNVLGPGGNFVLRDASKHVLLGDETALGLFACFARAAPGQCIGAVEVARGGGGWPELLGLDLSAAERTGERGDALLQWLEANEPAQSADVCFYLAGHTGSLVRIREWLLQRGFSRRSIRTKAYWADGKRGL
ncbi:siderophore-interacting protein [Polyangium jinanense]|uniref:Siderophore-interacting protein n=1 Tax=Polyangium jinanense TaxID=2829994 RepID=A0A9X3X458_9BACT|nr:siderophore-interacting protein [Polyangium jinanense]MDC3954171.1 siderophore-interacting protein [Polyangium jinanense]MDC3981873.1 siderophore-interacting protein [Polyangium jinanense]